MNNLDNKDYNLKIFEYKKSLRIKFKKIRKEIINKESKDKIIMKKILSLDFIKKAKSIGIYVDFDDEVSTRKLIEHFLKEKKIVAIPKIKNENEMYFVEILNLYDLDFKNDYGIEETSSSKEISDLDTLIIPGIVFDKENNRIGYGKGYFDKFLFNKKVFKIGICYKEQLINKLEYIDQNDVKMDMVISD